MGGRSPSRQRRGSALDRESARVKLQGPRARPRGGSTAVHGPSGLEDVVDGRCSQARANTGPSGRERAATGRASHVNDSLSIRWWVIASIHWAAAGGAG